MKESIFRVSHGEQYVRVVVGVAAALEKLKMLLEAGAVDVRVEVVE